MRSRTLLFIALVTVILLTSSITYAARVITKTPYLVATREIACGERLTARDVALYTPYKRYDYIPFTAFNDADEIIGKYVDLNLIKGDIILAGYLRDTANELTRCKANA